MLEGMGHQVHIETSGADALSTFRNNPDGSDLLMADLGMPDISGSLLAEKVLTLRTDIPVLLLTDTVQIYLGTTWVARNIYILSAFVCASFKSSITDPTCSSPRETPAFVGLNSPSSIMS